MTFRPFLSRCFDPNPDPHDTTHPHGMLTLTLMTYPHGVLVLHDPLVVDLVHALHVRVLVVLGSESVSVVRVFRLQLRTVALYRALVFLLIQNLEYTGNTTL
jgi:hypothetical protein